MSAPLSGKGVSLPLTSRVSPNRILCAERLTLRIVSLSPLVLNVKVQVLIGD